MRQALRRVGALLALALVGAGAGGLSAAPLVLTPTASQPGTGHANPLRGFHRWHDSTPDKQIVLDETPVDEYLRYRWKTLEPNLGDYSGIDTVLEPRIAAAAARGARFAFRVQGMVGYNDTQSYLPYDPRPPAPGFVPLHQRGVTAATKADGSEITFIPDWRDEGVLQAMEGLFAELGRRYAHDPRIAWIDIGWYGQFGEWVVRTPPPGVSYPRLDPNVESDRALMRRIVDAQANVFPGQQLVALVPYAAKPAIEHAFSLPRTRPVGLRSDCFGREGYFNQWTDRPAEWPLIRDRWLVAPVVGESCGRNENTPAAAQVMLDQAALLHLSSFGNGNFYGLNLDPEGLPLLRELARRIGFQLRPAEIVTIDKVYAGRSLPLATRWINEGLARLYERFDARFVLRPLTGGSEYGVVSAFDPAILLPGPATAPVADQLALPEGAPQGSYQLELELIEASASNRPPLKLSIGGRDAQGRYPLALITVAAAKVPGPPQITAIDSASRTLVVSFLPPADDGGRNIELFRVRCEARGGGFFSVETTASPAAVSGLQNGSLYTCTVAARNALGWGAPSPTWPGATPSPGPQAQRVFVSARIGNDSQVLQACPITAPCRALGTALGATLPQGEVVVLDSGDYDAIVIEQSLAIRVVPGAQASLPARPGGAVAVLGAGLKVHLQGLAINGQGPGDVGVSMLQGGRLVIDRCSIAGTGLGLDLAGGTQLNVTDLLLRDNQIGLRLAGGAQATVTGLRLLGANLAGMEVLAAAGEQTRLNLRASVLAHASHGIEVKAHGAAALARANLDRVRLDFGAGSGVRVLTTAGGSAVALLTASRVTGFGLGLEQADPGGSLWSTGGNVFSGNGSDVSGNLTPLPRQ